MRWRIERRVGFGVKTYKNCEELKFSRCRRFFLDRAGGGDGAVSYLRVEKRELKYLMFGKRI